VSYEPILRNGLSDFGGEPSCLTVLEMHNTGPELSNRRNENNQSPLGVRGKKVE
jgi:hypothetical protein